MRELILRPLSAPPRIDAGMDLAALILASLRASNQMLRDQDVVVLAQKIVSKAEGRIVDLETVEPPPVAYPAPNGVTEKPEVLIAAG